MNLIRSPQQTRSQKTLEKLLDAAEAILSEKSFDEASVKEIASRAGFTVGAFYARFSDKEALLMGLEERLRGHLSAFYAVLEAQSEVVGSLEDRIRFLVNAAVAVYERNSGTLAILRKRAKASDDWHERTLALNNEIRDALRAFLSPQNPAIRHPAPSDAVDVALLMLFSTLREMMVNGIFWPGVLQLERQRVIDELNRALHIYLSFPESDRH